MPIRGVSVNYFVGSMCMPEELVKSALMNIRRVNGKIVSVPISGELMEKVLMCIIENHMNGAEDTREFYEWVSESIKLTKLDLTLA
jgi:hypothetical protein